MLSIIPYLTVTLAMRDKTIDTAHQLFYLHPGSLIECQIAAIAGKLVFIFQTFLHLRFACELMVCHAVWNPDTKRSLHSDASASLVVGVFVVLQQRQQGYCRDVECRHPFSGGMFWTSPVMVAFWDFQILAEVVQTQQLGQWVPDSPNLKLCQRQQLQWKISGVVLS